MLLKTYESENLLCNLSVNGATTQADTYAYRGDLVLEEGEIADSSGRRKPPKSTLKQGVVLIKNDKLEMVAGTLNTLDLMPTFFNRYKKDLSPSASILFYVENLSKKILIDIDGIVVTLIPHYDGGAVWNTLMDDLRLDKDDFKGQTAEDKVITMREALADLKPKFDKVSYEEGLALANVARRETRGPV
ncbi:hypothetical protein [Azomonas macrocytogenes]|uniref:Uncharacterized protein n=1 Tax=Azomonas macrocytogenes TaxID=69962 RepID=A0A839T2X6_AZOMA|nr:hypothetical protein [Azomonas macrocytogenes]MBB3103891.1 hypothetical protein [Azomonas macrocytogenes]